MLFFKYLQGTGTAGGIPTTMVTSSSSYSPTQHTPPVSLKGVPSGFQNTDDQSARQMRSGFVPTSPYDSSFTARSQTSAMVADGQEIQNDPFLVGSLDSINKQVNWVASVCCKTYQLEQTHFHFANSFVWKSVEVSNQEKYIFV